MNSSPIGLFLPSLCGGGAERVMVTLANAFADRGFTVDLVLASAFGPYMKDVSSSVRVVDLAATRVVTSLPALIRYIRRERPVALVSALNHANVIAILARQLSGVPVKMVISEHSTFSRSRKNLSTFRGRAVARIVGIAYPKADEIIAVSEGVATDLTACLGLRAGLVRTIYNPIVTERMLVDSMRQPEHPWFASGYPPVVLGVGRLTKAKNFSLLIDAFAQLRREREARLVILGEGEERVHLEAQVRALRLTDSVDLPGFVPNPYSFMRAAALYVLSSDWEGLPTVLAEAMACGTPVVSTDCPSGPREILESGKWGRLVPVNDVEALADAMTHSLHASGQPDVASRALDFGTERAASEYLQLLLA